MSTLSENIKSFRKSKKLTQKDLAKLLNVAPTAVSAWELGRNKPLMDNVEQMAKIFEIKKSTLLGDEATTSTTPTEDSDTLKSRLIDNYTTLTTERRQKLVRASSDLVREQEHTDIAEPLVAYQIHERLAAGTGAALYDDYDTVYYTEDLPHDLASWIAGDSMEPTYLNGDVALIKDTSGTLDYQGAICAIVWDGKTYIKKVYQEETGLRLVSINPKYADLFAAYDEEPRIVGKIVGSFKPVER